MRGRALIGGLTLFGALGAVTGMFSRAATTTAWSLAAAAGGPHGHHWPRRHS